MMDFFSQYPIIKWVLVGFGILCFLDKYGISSFVFRARKPFHPDRFLNYLNTNFPQNIIRSKGLFWLASRSDYAIIWSTAGGSVKVDNAGAWWASMPFSERINYGAFLDNKEQVAHDWDITFGDRKTELVFIGQDLEKENMIQELNSCLLTDQEIELWINQQFLQEDQWPIAR